ncbi:MAG: hypothetical protein WKF75_11810 [Singulisphaera sp.]
MLGTVPSHYKFATLANHEIFVNWDCSHEDSRHPGPGLPLLVRHFAFESSSRSATWSRFTIGHGFI